MSTSYTGIDVSLMSNFECHILNYILPHIWAMLKSSRSQLIDLHWFAYVYHWSGMDKVIQENQDLSYNNSCFLCFQC